MRSLLQRKGHDIIPFVKVSTQRLPESQVLLEIEVEPDQMEESMDRAYRRLVQKVVVPGFRKGKTPRHMLERHLGRDRLLREAVDILIPEAYNQALDDEKIDPVGQPVIELVREEPLFFKATVPVKPTVDLGDYQQVRVDRPQVQVETGEVDEALEELRRRYALFEPVDRPVQLGDMVSAAVKGVVEGQQVYSDDDADFRIREGALIPFPGIPEGLVGVAKGETKEIETTAGTGQNAVFTVTVKEVKEERLPEVNDEFARLVGEGFPTLQSLRERLESDIRQRKDAEAEEEYRQRVVTALVEKAEQIEFPPVMVEQEVDRLLRDQAHSIGQDVDRYLQIMRKSLEELRAEFRPIAAERLRRSLALTQLSESENIAVDSAEVEQETERIVAGSGAQGEQMRQILSSADGRGAIERQLYTRKTIDRLVEIASQAPVELAEADEAVATGEEAENQAPEAAPLEALPELAFESQETEISTSDAVKEEEKP